MASIITVAEKMFPTFVQGSITYNKHNNIYLTSGYTSNAGNFYYQGLRLSNRIALVYDIGQGYAHTFLNGIKIYGFNGREKRLIASKEFYCNYYSESSAKESCVEMVKNYMKGEMKLLNASVEDSELRRFSEQLVDAAIANNIKLIA